MVKTADQKAKIATLTETGFPKGISHTKRSDWYTQVLLKTIERDPIARRLTYTLVWRNAAEDHCWIPYTNHPAADDLKAFYADPFTLFERDLPTLYTPPKS